MWEGLRSWSGTAEEPRHEPEVFVSHADAALTPRARGRLGRFLVVVEGNTVSQAAKRFDVSSPTAKRWPDRCRHLGEAG